MSFKRNRKYEQIALYAIISIAVVILFYSVLHRFDVVRESVNYALRILSPFIYGFIFAYLANPVMTFFEKNVFRFSEKRKRLFRMKRGFAVALTVIVIALFIFLFFILLIPQITNSYDDLQKQIGGYLSSAQKWADGLISNFPLLNGRFKSLNELLDLAEIKAKLNDLISNSYSILSTAVGGVVTYAGALVIELKNIFLGVILAVYFLLAKEKICAQIKKILNSVLSDRHFLNLYNLARHSDRSFGQFIRGKLLDSLIIGLLTFAVLWIFNFPFYPLIAVLVGVTNVIPLFGPFIGAIPSAFLIMIVEPGKLIWFIVIIVIIQQLDGNIIGPKIIGNVTGLSAMWIVVSITLFGSLFGVPGMLIAVPATSVIYAIVREATESRLKKLKKPHETSYYYNYPSSSDLPENTIFIHDKPSTAEEAQHVGNKNADTDSVSVSNRSNVKNTSEGDGK